MLAYIQPLSLLIQTVDLIPFQSILFNFSIRLIMRTLEYIPNDMIKLVRQSQTVQSAPFSSGIVGASQNPYPIYNQNLRYSLLLNPVSDLLYD